LVTGGSGFFGFRLVNHLLEQGYTVVTSVRSENPNKVKKLYNLQEKYRDKLSICIADLMVLNSFDKPCSKVDVVMHTATPVILDEIEDYENQLYKPAVQGTQNILDSCLKSNKVKVIIYTSSVGTMASHYPDPGVYNESSWQQVDKLEDSPYHYSKIQAEKLFLKFIEDNPKFRGIVINPGAIMGPYTNYELEMLSPYQVNNDFDNHVNNKIKLENYYKDYFPFIDVRDLAKAHELSMNNPNANGRFVL
ncbi:NAD(P)-binding protein, partial [Conidiobolus coronatus NRRL 28638]